MLCSGRSGSTLLRLLLDSHPDIRCPPESNIADLVGVFRHSFKSANGFDSRPPESTLRALRALVEAALNPESLPIVWCDKSLATWRNADSLREVWPSAKFICLYRHVMDFIASGIEACPWGFQAYGFAPYVARHPDNFVLALAELWFECTRATVDFEKRNPDVTCGMRYEDLVSDCEVVMRGLWKFLNVADVASSIELSPQRLAPGPSDHKIWFKGAVDTGSVGNGSRVPPGAIPPRFRAELNILLAELGYQPVTDSWGSWFAPELEKPDYLADTSAAESCDEPASDLAPLDDFVGQAPRVSDALIDQIVDMGLFDGCRGYEPIDLLIVEGPTVLHRQTVGDNQDAPESPDRRLPRLVVTKSAIVGLLWQSLDVPSAIRQGEIRYYSEKGVRDSTTDIDQYLKQLADTLGAGMPWSSSISLIA